MIEGLSTKPDGLEAGEELARQEQEAKDQRAVEALVKLFTLKKEEEKIII